MIKRPGDERPEPERPIEVSDRYLDRTRSADIVLVEIAKLQSDGERLKSDMGEVRADMREVRDRMIRLEEILRGEIGTRLSTLDGAVSDIKKKLDHVHNWVIGAGAVAAFLAIATQILLRVWPAQH